jgi:sacsin
LLFLKNVTKIGVYEMRESSERHVPHLLYEVRVPSFERGTDPRRAVSEWVASGGGTRQTFAERLRSAADDSLPSSTGWMDLDIQDGSVVETQRWLLSCALAGGAAKEMAISETGAARGLVPWVGAAARVPRRGSDDVSTEDGASEEKRTEKNKNLAVDGRAFCFLPLPVRTGLPVHVHAPFELSSNRRDVWHGEDASGGGRERGAWNATVLKHAVAPAYVALLRAAKVSSLGPSRLDSYYALFPGVEETQLVPEPWSVILPPLYASLAVEPCVEATDPAVSGSDGSCDTRKWIAPNKGVFPDVSTEALRLSFAPGGDLARAFAARGEWVIHGVPSGVAQAFLTHAPGLVRVATPRLAREAARSAPRKTKISDARLALATLAYCLSDVDFDSGDAGSAASELRDAPLLPLADGTLGSFRFGDSLREKDILFVPSDEAEARLLTGTGLGGNVRGGKNANVKPSLGSSTDRRSRRTTRFLCTTGFWLSREARSV